MLNRQSYTTKLRWIDNRYLIVLNEVKEGRIDVKFISGSDNKADGLTKPLQSPQFTEFVKGPGLTEQHIQQAW